MLHALDQGAEGTDGQGDGADVYDDGDVDGDCYHHQGGLCLRSPRSPSPAPGHSAALAATGRADSVSLPLRKLCRSEVQVC